MANKISLVFFPLRSEVSRDALQDLEYQVAPSPSFATCWRRVRSGISPSQVQLFCYEPCSDYWPGEKTGRGLGPTGHRDTASGTIQEITNAVEIDPYLQKNADARFSR